MCRDRKALLGLKATDRGGNTVTRYMCKICNVVMHDTQEDWVEHMNSAALCNAYRKGQNETGRGGGSWARLSRRQTMVNRPKTHSRRPIQASGTPLGRTDRIRAVRSLVASGSETQHIADLFFKNIGILAILGSSEQAPNNGKSAQDALSTGYPS